MTVTPPTHTAPADHDQAGPDHGRLWIPPLPTPLELAAGTGAGVWAAASAPILRRTVQRAFGPQAARPGSFDATATDAGWFGPDSIAWRVHADTSMLVAGMSAFALQALHPRAMAGVWDHSAFGGDFFGRIRRTGEFVQGVVYDGAEAAERRCLALRRIHGRVVGHTPDGRPYSANDPELLEWVHITEYLAIAAANRRFASHPMTDGELDLYVAEVARVGQAVGVVDPPRSWNELMSALRRHRPQLAVGEQAALAVGFLENPEILHAAARPAWRAVWSGAVVCLPPVARRLLRTGEPSPVELAACRAVVRATGRFLGTPGSLLAARKRLGLADA